VGRKRQYASAAERLRAFRARSPQKEQAEPVPSPSGPKRKTSRPARLVSIENEVRALIDEYQAWIDRLPGSLHESDLAGKLEEAIDKLTEVAETLADIDLPKGFGRD